MKQDKLFAEFLGYRFESDWNWLMAVVKRITDLGYSVTITESSCRIVGKNPIANRIYIETQEEGMFKNTYEACHSFVSGYKVN